MDPQYIAALEETLQGTFNPQTVKLATAKLAKDLYSNPLALPLLLQILHSSQQDQVKQLAAVEARKLVGSNWEKLDAGLKPQIREALLASTFSQPLKVVRHASARVVAAIGEVDLDVGQWDLLLPSLFEHVQLLEPQAKEMAVYTLYTLLETQVPALLPHQDTFVTLFGGLLQDPTSREIRVNAALSLDVLSQFIEEDEEINEQTAAKFKASIPGMVSVLQDVISADDTELARSVFNVLNSLIFLDNKLVGDQIVGLLQIVTEVAANTSLDEEYRAMALQFLVSCVSLRKSKISSNNLGPQLAAVATRIASEEVDEDAELNNEDEENENEESEPPSLGLRLLAMMAAELPPSQVITPLFEALPGMVNSDNKFARRAGFLCLGVVSSGAPDYLLTQLGKVAPVLIHGLQDPEPIARLAALRALTNLSAELQDNIAEYHQQLLPLIVDIINLASHVMIYKHACYALDGLVEFMNHTAIAQYVEPLMTKLFSMLQEANSSSLKTAIVSAIGSTAFASGKGFTPYFNRSLQELEPFVTNAAQVDGMLEDDIQLRAVTFENISTMARAVGSGSFSTFAQPLVEAAYTALSSEHSRIRESGFAFISNMAKVYGSEFSGFLANLVPQILKCLEQEEFQLNLDDDDEFGDDDENLENKFQVNTGITIEKEIASVALGELAMGTGAAFAPYLEDSITTLSEQFETSYGMREAALNALWKIVRAMVKASYGDNFKAPQGVPDLPYLDASLVQLIEKARDLTINGLEDEYELTLIGVELDNLGEALQDFGALAVVSDKLHTQSLEKLCHTLLSILKKEHPSQLNDEEEDVEETGDSSESEALLHEAALEVVILLSLKLGRDFVPVFETFKDVILASVMLKSKNKRVSSIGALAEISVGLKDANPYALQLLEVFTERLANDKSLEVKGNGAYGVGIIIETSPTDFSAQYQQILQVLFHLLSRGDQEGKVDDQETKDVVNRLNANACGCVARMALKNLAAIPLEHVLPALLSHLPVQAAPEENVPILKLILQLYESGNPLIAQQSERVILIFAEMFTKEAERVKLVEESTLGREEYLDKMKQFQTDELKQKVVDLLKFLNQSHGQLIAQHDILKSVV